MKQIEHTIIVKRIIKHLKKNGIYGDLLNSIRDILIHRISSDQIDNAILYLNSCLGHYDISSLRIFIQCQDPNSNRANILLSKLKSLR